MDVVYCPILRPIVFFISQYFTESKAFILIDEMIKKPISEEKGYLPVNKTEFDCFINAFDKIIKDKYKNIYKYLINLPDYNVMIFYKLFSEFFFSILSLNQCLNIFDSYLLEGYSVLYRYGLAIIYFLYPQYKDCKTCEEFESILYNSQISDIDFKKITKIAFSYRLNNNTFKKTYEKQDELCESKKVNDEILKMRILNHTPQV